MQWLTEREAKKAAKTRKGAIACSRKKWKQLSTATQTEVIALGNEPPCALCRRYYLVSSKFQHKTCPIRTQADQITGNTCCQEWRSAASARYAFIYRPTLANFRKWRKAARAMLSRLTAIK